MSGAAQREWRFYLDDMINFAGKVVTYTQGFDQEGFVASGLNYDAVAAVEATKKVWNRP
jgi:uncharacterized protein with HEPN domain